MDVATADATVDTGLLARRIPAASWVHADPWLPLKHLVWCLPAQPNPAPYVDGRIGGTTVWPNSSATMRERQRWGVWVVAMVAMVQWCNGTMVGWAAAGGGGDGGDGGDGNGGVCGWWRW